MSHERQPIEEWCEDNEALIISTAEKLGLTGYDKATILDLVYLARNTNSLFDKWVSDTSFQGEL